MKCMYGKRVTSIKVFDRIVNILLAILLGVKSDSFCKPTRRARIQYEKKNASVV